MERELQTVTENYAFAEDGREAEKTCEGKKSITGRPLVADASQCIFCDKDGFRPAEICKALGTLYCKKDGECAFFRDRKDTYVRKVSYAGREFPEYVTEEEARSIDRRRYDGR